MASAPKAQLPPIAPPVAVGERSVAALALLIAAGIVYATMGVVGLVPLPASLAQVHRWAPEGGHMRLVVWGYYRSTSPVATVSGAPSGYVLAASPAGDESDAVPVNPSPDDLREGKVAAVINTAAGHGTPSSPFAVRTLASFGRFASILVAAALISFGFAYWVAGTVVALARRRT